MMLQMEHYDIRFSFYTNTFYNLKMLYNSNWFLATNAWYHAVFVKSSTNGMTVYINGSSVATNTAATGDLGNNTSSGATNSVGYYRTSSDSLYFNGQLDQFRIYNSVLSQDQITELYNEKPETDTSNFKTVVYDGTGGSDYISNVGIDLETNGGLIWFKERNGTNHHQLYDNVRGYNYALYSNLTNAQYDYSAHSNGDLAPASVEANGFLTSTVANNGINRSGGDYVAWVWLGGGQASNIAVNSITGSTPSIASDVSANTGAGFSIVKHSGTSTVGTIAHGLNQAPEFIMTKSSSHDTGDGFTVYADGLAQSSSYLNMASSSIPNPNSVVWTTNAPTADIFNVGTATGINNSGKTYISYCWHSVSGYSEIGTYEGTGSNGNVITMSDSTLKPNFFMIKNVDSTGHWIIYDATRDRFVDTLNEILYANLTNAEATASTARIYNRAAGTFTVDSSSSAINSSGHTFLYMAFK